MTRGRCYSELSQLQTLEDRFLYLALKGAVGEPTFGYERWVNQRFYRSREWKDVRDLVIDRDFGCDLGVPGFEIHSRLVIHHMNPITRDEILAREDDILDPEYLITTTHDTHNAIHYGDERQLPRPFVERRPGDTALWYTGRD